MERAMKVQDVMLQAMAKKITWWQAADPAYSPQARGRSERNFSTWQGRLPQELRLRQLGTLGAANRFLREDYIPEFNRRFQSAPAPHPQNQPAPTGEGTTLKPDISLATKTGHFNLLPTRTVRTVLVQ